MQRKEKRQVRVIGVEKIKVAEVEGIVARDCGEKGIQQVVAFVIKLGVMNAEHFVEGSGGALDERRGRGRR